MRRFSKFIVAGIFLFGVVAEGWAQKGKKGKTGTYFEGKMAGESAAGAGNEMWIGAGVGSCVGFPLCYIYPLVISGEPPYYLLSQMQDKTEEYKNGFIDGYKRKKKNNALVGTTGGCVVNFIFVIIYVLAVMTAPAE